MLHDDNYRVNFRAIEKTTERKFMSITQELNELGHTLELAQDISFMDQEYKLIGLMISHQDVIDSGIFSGMLKAITVGLECYEGDYLQECILAYGSMPESIQEFFDSNSRLLVIKRPWLLSEV